MSDEIRTPSPTGWEDWCKGRNKRTGAPRNQLKHLDCRSRVLNNHTHNVVFSLCGEVCNQCIAKFFVEVGG